MADDADDAILRMACTITSKIERNLHALSRCKLQGAYVRNPPVLLKNSNFCVITIQRAAGGLEEKSAKASRELSVLLFDLGRFAVE